MASKMGIEVVAYDPPRAERDANFTTSSLEEVLDCDVLSLHTPLVESGPLATRGWLDSIKLSMRNRTLLIQASRGGVADEAAVLSALRNGDLQDAVIDVWQDEPRVNRQLLDLAVVGTPHIAGYSNRAKRLATELAIADMFRCLVGGAAIHPDQVERPPLLLAEPPKAKVDLLLESEHDLLPIPLIDDFLDYDKSLRNTLRTANIADQIAEFRRLRTKLPYRDEFRDVNGLLFPSGKWPLLDVFREI
jgi:erythronate-4-phosphate dehydrogenase